jgi:glycine hydroxymethyltransferase
VNKNTIPFDKNKPMVGSGIRLGTPALTTRGMGEAEMETIAGWIADVLANAEDEACARRVKAEVEKLCQRFPLYQGRLKAHESAARQ